MPLYSYINDDTGETIELLQSMSETHSYEVNGVKWRRLWEVPQVAIDTKIDPRSEADFLKKTSKGGTVGDLWSLSEEMSHLRAEKDGKDFIKEKAQADTKARDESIKKARRAEILNKRKKFKK